MSTKKSWNVVVSLRADSRIYEELRKIETLAGAGMIIPLGHRSNFFHLLLRPAEGTRGAARAAGAAVVQSLRAHGFSPTGYKTLQELPSVSAPGYVHYCR